MYDIIYMYHHSNYIYIYIYKYGLFTSLYNNCQLSYGCLDVYIEEFCSYCITIYIYCVIV